MTVRAAHSPPAAQTATAADAAAPMQTPFGVIVGGTLAGDVVVMSPRAVVLARAGTLVRTLIIAGLASLRRTVPLTGGRMLRLQDGVYRVI